MIAGMQSNYCIDATTRRAVQEGFNVTLVSAAHSTFSFTEVPAEAIIEAQNTALGKLVPLAKTTEVSFR